MRHTRRADTLADYRVGGTWPDQCRPQGAIGTEAESGKSLGQHLELAGIEFGDVILFALDLGSGSWRGRSGWGQRRLGQGVACPLAFLHLVAEGERAGQRTLDRLHPAAARRRGRAANVDRRSRLPDAVEALLRVPVLTSHMNRKCSSAEQKPQMAGWRRTADASDPSRSIRADPDVPGTRHLLIGWSAARRPRPPPAAPGRGA